MTLLKISLLLLGLLSLLTCAAQDAYSAKSGFYSLTLPSGWEHEAADLSLVLTRQEVRITILELEATAPEAALEAALAELEIKPGALLSSVEAPLSNGTWKQQIYSEGAQLVVALAQVRDGQALAIVIEGEQSAVQALNPQILQLLTSISFGEANLPDYVDRSSFSESEVQFGMPPFVLAGSLSIPRGEGPFPALVIVHGSGPQSRDGTLGPLAAYRDIAQGLATRGIAALRYDKRSFSHAAEITMDENFTVDSESTDDALLAGAFLREQPEIDSERIFVLGHSQGGSLTPRILSRDSTIAGGILLAAATQDFSQLLSGQIAYIGEFNPAALESPAMAGLQQLVDAFAAVEAGASYADAFGEQGNYFQSLQELAPLQTARELARPLLILQGERDYQVTMANYADWQEAFAAEERVRTISYPALNHMFMATGDLGRLSIPQDYEIPAFVDAAVIEDIATWIEQQGQA